eukprot:10450398-Prorocentrum_lima.AAC.1
MRVGSVTAGGRERARRAAPSAALALEGTDKLSTTGAGGSPRGISTGRLASGQSFTMWSARLQRKHVRSR